MNYGDNFIPSGDDHFVHKSEGQIKRPQSIMPVSPISAWHLHDEFIGDDLEIIFPEFPFKELIPEFMNNLNPVNGYTVIDCIPAVIMAPEFQKSQIELVPNRFEYISNLLHVLTVYL